MLLDWQNTIKKVLMTQPLLLAFSVKCSHTIETAQTNYTMRMTMTLTPTYKGTDAKEVTTDFLPPKISKPH